MRCREMEKSPKVEIPKIVLAPIIKLYSRVHLNCPLKTALKLSVYFTLTLLAI